jgi:hypothetical protein
MALSSESVRTIHARRDAPLRAVPLFTLHRFFDRGISGFRTSLRGAGNSCRVE